MDILQNVSQEYDLELEFSKKLSYEALCAISPNIRKQISDYFMKFYYISKSINKTKRQIANQH